MKLEIPLQLKLSANLIYGGRHWILRKKDADAYHGIIKDACSLLEPVRGYPVVIDIVFHFANRPLDCSNCLYMTKLIEDGLIKCGILEDDGFGFVKTIVISTGVDKQNPRIEIDIQEA